MKSKINVVYFKQFFNALCDQYNLVVTVSEKIRIPGQKFKKPTIKPEKFFELIALRFLQGEMYSMGLKEPIENKV